MSHVALFDVVLETAREYGITTDVLINFKSAIIEKLRAKEGIRFAYTDEFLRQFKGRCAMRPDGIPDISTPLSPTESKALSDDSPKNRRGKPRYVLKKVAERPGKLETVLPPLPPPSEEAWTPGRFRQDNKDPKVAAIRLIGGKLNKMAESNYDKMSVDIVSTLVPEYIEDFIPMIFDKAIWDVKFRHMYAKLCLELLKKFGKDAFGKPLLIQCQAEFTKRIPTEPETDDGDEYDEYEHQVNMWKKRRLGGIHFIAELLKVRIITPNIIVVCLHDLLKHSPVEPIADNVQHAAELLSLCRGHMGETEVEATSPTVQRLATFLKAGKLPFREKFKVEDTLALF